MAEVQIGSILVRKAVPDDGPALASAIEQINGETVFLAEPGQALGWAESAQQRLREMQTTDSGLYMVATNARAIIGYVGAFSGRLARVRSVIFVRHLGVRQSFRRQGVGRRLVASIESWARAKQAHRLELRLDEGNAAALSLYRGTGFQIEGRIADAVRLDGRWHAHYWMGLSVRARTEPRWSSFDQPRPEQCRHIEQLTLRAPLPT